MNIHPFESAGERGDAAELRRLWPLLGDRTVEVTRSLIDRTLRSAIINHREKGVTCLLELGVPPEGFRPQAPEGSPLYLAVLRAHPPIVRLLLDAGADPYRTNAKGETPLSQAHLVAKHPWQRAEGEAIIELLTPWETHRALTQSLEAMETAPPTPARRPRL